MEDTLHALSAGDRVRNYEILGLAGKGGMGFVYKARDIKLDRVVALKFLPPHLTFSERDRHRLLMEARSASSLDHPNIGVVHDIEETDDGQPFIVMAFYEGQTLAQRIASGPLPMSEAVDIFHQIVSGMAEAHEHHIIHRDIKPSNILLTRQNTAKIVDFGLALVIKDTESTRSLGAPGTAVYMAPEQTQGVPADDRSDIWALGVVLAEMLLGHHPFLRESFAATLLAILYYPPDSLDSVPQELQAIAYRALAKEPASRYQSCTEMLEDVERFRNHLESAERQETVSFAQPISSRNFKKYVQAASHPSSDPAALQRKTRRWQAGALVVTVLLSLLWLPPVRNWLDRTFFHKAPIHIAVLPFTNSGSTPINPAVADGLMESMTNKLSNIEPGQESLWVVPTCVVRERKVETPAAAERELGATHVVTGAITRDEQSVRLTLHLIRTRNLSQVGSVEVEDPAGDIRGLQEEAVRRLVLLLNLKAPASAGPADSSVPAAYEAYLKAVSHIQRYDKQGNIDLAISELQSALHQDPQFALGYAQLGEAYRLKYQQEHDPKLIAAALNNCNKALALNNGISAVYVTLGRIHNDAGNHDLSVEEFQHALDLDPRNADAINGMAYAQEGAGRIKEAEATFKRAAALRPDYWDGYNTLGTFYLRQRRFDDAIAQFRRAQQLTPDNTEVYSNLAMVYIASGRQQDLPLAESALKKSIELNPTYPALANLGYLYLQQKRYIESAEFTRRALQLNDKNYVVWENLDWAYRWTGKNDLAAAARQKAFALLEKAAQSSPRDGQVQAHLALQYAHAGQREPATTRLEAALALAPDDPDVLANVSDTYGVLGDHRQALSYAQLSLAKGYTLDDLARDPDMRAVLDDPGLNTIRH